MRDNCGKCFLLLFLLVVSLPCAAQAGKVDSLAAPTDPGVPDAVKKVLGAKGFRVTLDDGSVAGDIWFCQEVAAQAKKDVPGALYPQLAEATLLGVISFAQATTDYRGQAIKPGFYTLRYALLPNDGNHLGVAPNRDFLLLIPAASDADPAATFTPDQLVQLSRKASGTPHPAPLSLIQAEGGTAPAVSKDDEEHWVLSAGIRLVGGQDLPIALVVKGTAPQ